MSLLRDILDGFFGWQFDGDPAEFNISIGCGCFVILVMLALAVAGGFWLGTRYA